MTPMPIMRLRPPRGFPARGGASPPVSAVTRPLLLSIGANDRAVPSCKDGVGAGVVAERSGRVVLLAHVLDQSWIRCARQSVQAGAGESEGRREPLDSGERQPLLVRQLRPAGDEYQVSLCHQSFGIVVDLRREPQHEQTLRL